MIPILFLVCVVAIKVFKKITPNGECAELPSIPPLSSAIPRPQRGPTAQPLFLPRRQDHGVPWQARLYRSSRLRRSHRWHHRHRERLPPRQKGLWSGTRSSLLFSCGCLGAPWHRLPSHNVFIIRESPL
jgi:hypothetical protein